MSPLLSIFALIAILNFCESFPQSVLPQQREAAPKPLLYVAPNVRQYDLSVLEPQFQPSYNFIGDKQHFPRLQPQIFIYQTGSAPGQPFLLQPVSPPGNFLVPQPGPNVILRDSPQRPLFVAGYPKPAHIPPIEKDAEEIPTNPPFHSKGEKIPEKLETFNEGEDTSRRQATEAEVLAAADRNPFYNDNSRPSLRPGQRFFILNGQPLFPNYPYNSQLFPSVDKYIPTAQFKQFDDKTPQNLILLNQPESLHLRDSIPLNIAPKSEEFLEIRDRDVEDNDAVVIDAREHDENINSESEVVYAPEKSAEPTISQAGPGAIALAGPGGVAEAAPRATAFVGKEGVAVSSPQATAVAGPAKDETTGEKKKNKNKRRQ